MKSIKCSYSQINFSELAGKYGASEKTKLSNMVVKEFVCKNGVDVEKYKSQGTSLKHLW